MVFMTHVFLSLMLVEKMNERRLLRHKSTVWTQVYLHYIMPAPDWNACFRAQMGRAQLFRRTLPRPCSRKRRIRRLRLHAFAAAAEKMCSFIGSAPVFRFAAAQFYA
jgi:hypothetical protein